MPAELWTILVDPPTRDLYRTARLDAGLTRIEQR